jgi:hypothetical protein
MDKLLQIVHIEKVHLGILNGCMVIIMLNNNGKIMTVEFKVGDSNHTVKYVSGVWYVYYREHRIRHLDINESNLITGAIKFAIGNHDIATEFLV